GRLAGIELAHLADRQWLVVVATDCLDARLRADLANRWCLACDHLALEGLRAYRTATVTPDAAADEAARRRRHFDATDHTALRQQGAIDLHARAVHRTRIDEGVMRDRGVRAVVAAVRVVEVRDRTATRVVVVDVGDVGVVDDRRV